MIKKRNGFLTFCFSMLPGAGHMYNGFMKRGVSIMLAFFAIWFLAYSVNIYGLGMFAPVVWFFAFFDCMNLRFRSDEDFYMQEDDYLFHLESIRRFWVSDSKIKPVVGVCLIAVGVYSLLHSVLLPFLYRMDIIPTVVEKLFSSLSYVLPRLIVAVLIIMAGVALIMGKKQDLSLDAEPNEPAETNNPENMYDLGNMYELEEKDEFDELRGGGAQ